MGGEKTIEESIKSDDSFIKKLRKIKTNNQQRYYELGEKYLDHTLEND